MRETTKKKTIRGALQSTTSHKATAPKKGEVKSAKPPSNRQLIRDTIDAEGEMAAKTLGKKLGMSAPTVDAYIKGWARIKSGGTNPKQTPISSPLVFDNKEPWFRFPSPGKAEAWRKSRPEVSGLKPEAFKIVPEPGVKVPRYAVIPDVDYIKKYGAFTKPALRALEKQGFQIEGGSIQQVRVRKKAA